MTCCVFGFFPCAYGHLLMQNSHLTVLRQATQLSLAQSESAKALQGHTADNVGVSLLSFQYEDYKKLSPSGTSLIIFVMPPHPGGGQQPFGLRSGGAPSHRKQLKEQDGTDKKALRMSPSSQAGKKQSYIWNLARLSRM